LISLLLLLLLLPELLHPWQLTAWTIWVLMPVLPALGQWGLLLSYWHLETSWTLLG
jgi:hypothetical protein